MEYEFKSIVLSVNVNDMLDESSNTYLNEYFSDGWEYVSSICQSYSPPNNFKGFGPVLVILKKKKK